MQTTVPTWTLGDRLRKSLQHAGLTPEDMAEQLGVSPTSVRGWMADRHIPNRATIMTWANITSVPLEWLAEDLFTVPPLRARKTTKATRKGGFRSVCAPWDSNPEPADFASLQVAA